MGAVFETILTAVMVGMVTGTIYGLIGLGIVLIFKSQKVINFAQAEFATFGAFMLFVFRVQMELPYFLAGFLAVSATVVLSILVERLVIRPLRGSPDVTVFVATAGVALLIIGVTFIVAGANINIVPPVFPDLERSFGEAGRLVGLVSPQRLMVLSLLLLCAGSLAVFFSKTTLGKGILAMSAEPFAVRLAGISTEKMSIMIWGIAGLVAGLAGVAFVPTSALTPAMFTGIALIPALTAVVIGGLTSLPGAFVGGLIIGFISEIAAAFTPAQVPGPEIIASFLVLLLTLLFRPKGLLAREA
jgi:branched-chain amino acid transport system permease protein